MLTPLHLTLDYMRKLSSTREEDWVSIFDSLKSKDQIEIIAPSVMASGTGKKPRRFKVGRRSKGRGYERISLEKMDGTKTPAPAKFYLWKRYNRREGSYNIRASRGDLALSLQMLRKV